ncbi:Transcription factor [Ciborinia camelliae]|nr:Transcription factor [Ciborinia camelliae]
MSASPTGESSTNANSANGINPADEKPRLSEHEKKANHIASEQKRRLAIREGFDRLADLVPGLEGQGRSESVVLKKTVDYIRMQLEERRMLVEEAESLGVVVEEGLKGDAPGAGSAGLGSREAGWGGGSG